MESLEIRGAFPLHYPCRCVSFFVTNPFIEGLEALLAQREAQIQIDLSLYEIIVFPTQTIPPISCIRTRDRRANPMVPSFGGGSPAWVAIAVERNLEPFMDIPISMASMIALGVEV